MVVFLVENFLKAAKFPRNFILAIQHILHPCTLRCFSGLATLGLFFSKNCLACPFSDQNLAPLAFCLARIGLSFFPVIFLLWLRFSLNKPFLFSVFMLGVISPPPFYFIFTFFFLVSCYPLSVLPNNILQIFVYHYLRIINDTFIHCTNISLLR